MPCRQIPVSQPGGFHPSTLFGLFSFFFFPPFSPVSPFSLVQRRENYGLSCSNDEMDGRCPS
jgi:hypothetical protein